MYSSTKTGENETETKSSPDFTRTTITFFASNGTVVGAGDSEGADVCDGVSVLVMVPVSVAVAVRQVPVLDEEYVALTVPVAVCAVRVCVQDDVDVRDAVEVMLKLGDT